MSKATATFHFEVWFTFSAITIQSIASNAGAFLQTAMASAHSTRHIAQRIKVDVCEMTTASHFAKGVAANGA